jgi:hypoxanthine-DNA glycosylase
MFRPADEAPVVALWRKCGLTRPWNDPHKDIARKLAEQPELFLVGTVNDKVIASAMAGYDGHRGWVYYLAVSPRHRRKSYGRALMQEIERRLTERGCPKINLLVRSSNQDVIEFYRRLGYVQDEVASLGKRLIHDQAPAASSLSRSFPPIADGRSRVLVLGSMPGRESLRASQYYAHPRNAFWPILGELLGFGAELPYEARVRALRSAGIALWDVLHSCKRDGSLDASIEAASETANDFLAFFRAHPAIRTVFFNGAKAESAFERHVAAALAGRKLRYRRLPSTSPAHAGMPVAKKLAAWRAVLNQRTR